jgi:hypothetical protein
MYDDGMKIVLRLAAAEAEEEEIVSKGFVLNQQGGARGIIIVGRRAIRRKRK